MTVVGIDYSLSCPCVCVARDPTFQNSFFHYLTDRQSAIGSFGNIMGDEHDEYLTNEQRYENNASWVLNIVGELKKKDLYIMIEDYSFGSKGRVFNLAENCGLLKYMLYKQGYNFFTVPPSVLKKYATGKGNANKDAMYTAFMADTMIDLKTIFLPHAKLGSPVTDIVDSWYLARYMIHSVKLEKT